VSARVASSVVRQPVSISCIIFWLYVHALRLECVWWSVQIRRGSQSGPQGHRLTGPVGMGYFSFGLAQCTDSAHSSRQGAIG